MTQQQLAERLGVAKSGISYYESGDRFPSYDVLIRISRTFHISTDALLGLERQRTLDASGLTEEQIALVAALIDALRNR